MVDFARDKDTGLELELELNQQETIEQPQFFMPQPLRAPGARAEEFRARWWPADLPDAERDGK
jgi:hypothetical protein